MIRPWLPPLPRYHSRNGAELVPLWQDRLFNPDRLLFVAATRGTGHIHPPCMVSRGVGGLSGPSAGRCYGPTHRPSAAPIVKASATPTSRANTRRPTQWFPTG